MFWQVLTPLFILGLCIGWVGYEVVSAYRLRYRWYCIKDRYGRYFASHNRWTLDPGSAWRFRTIDLATEVTRRLKPVGGYVITIEE